MEISTACRITQCQNALWNIFQCSGTCSMVGIAGNYVLTVRLKREPRLDFSPRTATAARERNSENHQSVVPHLFPKSLDTEDSSREEACSLWAPSLIPFNCLKYGERPKLPGGG